MKIFSFCKKIRNSLIVKMRNFIFDIYDKTPLVGRPLVAFWNFLDDVKSEIEKRTLQLKARLMPGDDTLRKELEIFFKGIKDKDFKEGNAYQPYQPIINSGLKDLPFLKEGEVRFKIIKENFSAPKGTLLDIGANLGYFCHKFEDEGFDCYAVEANRMLCYFMEKLRRAERKKFKVISQSIFDYKRNKDLVFDVVLALSVLHNFLQRKDTYFGLIKLLKRLKAQELFLETYFFDPSNPPKNYYKNYTPDEFVSFIIENSSFKKAEFIGKSEQGRPIYKLTP